MANDSAGRGLRGSSADSVLLAVRVHGPSTQAALARHTGLSRATVNNVVKKLQAEGVVALDWINGKEALVTLALRGGTIATVEVGTQRVRASLYRFDQESHAHHRVHASDAGTTPADAVRALSTLCQKEGVPLGDLTVIAVAMQAPIDRGTGAIAAWAAVRFPAWKGLALDKFFSEQFKVPVVVDNDANFAALAEWTWGAGQGSSEFLYLMCSEGVGGGLVLGGKLYRGGSGVAGEIGHMVLEEAGPLCFCGSRGCLHALISEKAILAALKDSPRPRESLADVITGAAEDDATCQRVLFDAGRRLGRAIANAARVVAPSTIAIGGTLSTAGALLMSSLEATPEMHSLRRLTSTTKISLAALPDAVALGGVAASLDLIDRGLSVLPAWLSNDSAGRGS